jgi:hypothetical protein
MWGSDVLNECINNADASSRAETYKKMFGNISSLASSITEDRSSDSDSSSTMPLLPLAMKVCAKTIGFDLVNPIEDEFSEITEDGELIEAEFDGGMSAPSGKLYFMDVLQP